MKFEWDENKNIENIRKHGVKFEDACYIFSDPYGLSKFDQEHSHDEDRWIMLARSPLNDRILVVVHTYREVEGREVVRIISARRATKNEAKVYIARVK